MPVQPTLFNTTNLERFLAFHAANLHVYVELRRRALAMRLVRETYSIRTIGESVRHDFDVRTQREDEFRMNNNHFPFYAVLLMAREPILRGFFARRGGGDGIDEAELLREVERAEDHAMETCR